MKDSVGFILLALTIFSCQPKNFSPDQCFSEQQQKEVIAKSIRYSAKLAPHATHATKFNKEFDSYYAIAIKETDLRACAFNATDTSYYFLITRKARSIWPAREAIGGKLAFHHDSLTNYEEVFRTWKMTEDTLNVRASELFEHMVNGEDLIHYRSKYKGTRYIEFPDDRYYFNKQKARWSDRISDSLNWQ